MASKSNVLQRLKRNSDSKLAPIHNIFPTFTFQDSLPKLPVPKLEDTTKRYLDAVKVMKDNPKFGSTNIKRTSLLLNNFNQTVGPMLQNRLLERNKTDTETSYATRMWNDYYLKDRTSLALNNPYVQLWRDENELMNDQLVRATNLIISSVRYWKALKNENLKPSIHYTKDAAKSLEFQKKVLDLPNNQRYFMMAMNGAYPCDMNPLRYILATNRIPGANKDELKHFPGSMHIVVLHSGTFYKFDVLDDDGNIVSPEEIARSLSWIQNSKISRPDFTIAYLPSSDRSTWARARKHLINIGNEQQISDIESAIISVVLSEEDGQDVGGENGCKIMLHNGAESMWFDKSTTLIVAKNGEAGICFEHTWGDGSSLFHFTGEILDDSKINPAINPNGVKAMSNELPGNVHQLEFAFDDIAKADIEEAKGKFLEKQNSLTMKRCTYEIDRNFLRERNVTYDALIQLAFQITQKRIYGYPSVIYEPVSQRGFKGGRLEIINTCTEESQIAANTLADSAIAMHDNKNPSSTDVVIKSCVAHKRLLKKALLGEGYFQHLASLSHLAEDAGIETDLFEDPVWAAMNHYVLSSSNVQNVSCCFGGFAPAVADGYGIAYRMLRNCLILSVTTYPTRSAHEFTDKLIESLSQIHSVLK